MLPSSDGPHLLGLNIKLSMNFQYCQSDGIKGTQRDLKIIFLLKMRLSTDQLKCYNMKYILYFLVFLKS